MTAPLLSVVVPFFNVQDYIADCLDSLQRQTFTDFEVVLVDDGSQDDSLAVAEEFVERDRRFTLVRQANAGLGPARNTGTEHASGRYITYVDSDDIVAPRAYGLMVGSLQRTGSDIATGNALRFNRTIGFEQSWAHQWAFRQTRFRTHINKVPDLVYDRMIWNKVFRRSFWDQRKYAFPPIRYEDYPVTFPAHVQARTVDVFNDFVYFWRVRDSGDSITQMKFNLDNVRDRYTSAMMVLDDANLLKVEPAVRWRLNRHFIDVDLFALADAWVKAEGPDKEPAREMMISMANRLDPNAAIGLQHATRLVHSAILADDLDLAAEAILWRSHQNPARLARSVVSSPKASVLGPLAQAGLREARKANPLRARTLRAELLDCTTEGDHLCLRLGIRFHPSLAARAKVKTWVASRTGSASFSTTAEPGSFGDGHQGLVATVKVPADRLAIRESQTLMVGASCGGLRWRGAVDLPASMPDALHASDGSTVRVKPSADGKKALAFWHTKWSLDVQQVLVDGEDFVLHLDRPIGDRDVMLVQRPDPDADLVLQVEPEATTVRVPVSALVAGEAVDNPVQGFAEREFVVRRGRIRPPETGGELSTPIPPAVPEAVDPTDPFGTKRRFSLWDTDEMVLTGQGATASTEGWQVSLCTGAQGTLVARLAHQD